MANAKRCDICGTYYTPVMIDLKYLFDKYGINCTGILHVGASTGQERDTYAELKMPSVS